MKKIYIISLLCSYAITLFANPIQEATQIFHPKVAKNGMVATQDYLATEVGVNILKKGGNAVDAAVAVGFALAVTLPRAGNIGGGGFMMIWLNDKKKAVAINYREKAPAEATKTMYQNKSGSIIQGKSTDSYPASGVPGTVAGLALAQKQYGTLPLAEVIQPAIDLANDGFIVSFKLANSLKHSRQWLSRNKATRQKFFKPDGSPLEPGDLWKQPDLARSLTMIAEQGPEAFYEGSIAKKIVAEMQHSNGLVTTEDLKNYKANIVEPVTGTYRGYKIYSMPPPSSGGVILIELLNILEGFPLSTYGLNDAQYVHTLAEAMSLAYYDRNNKLGDPAFVNNPVDKLTSDEYAKSLRVKVSDNKHTPSKVISQDKSANAYESPETTQFSIIDKNGNMVSNTYTLNYSFGNGQVIPDTGILMNNEMDDFTSKVGVPNAYGLIQGEANAIAPGKQPLSSMTPTIITDQDDNPFIATGSPGGSRIITTVLQVILNVIDHQLNLQTAVNTPRMHNQLWPDQISIEMGFSEDTIHILEEMDHRVVLRNAMGSAQTVGWKDNLFYGAADPRRPGASAEGY